MRSYFKIQREERRLLTAATSKTIQLLTRD